MGTTAQTGKWTVPSKLLKMLLPRALHISTLRSSKVVYEDLRRAEQQLVLGKRPAKHEATTASFDAIFVQLDLDDRKAGRPF